jgi:hypothetical protein
MSGSNGGVFTDEAVACIAARWNLTEEMARRRWQRESGSLGSGAASEPDMKAAALWYAKRGIPVLPLQWPINGGCSCGKQECHSPGKHPRTPRGFKDATTDEAQVVEWWNSCPSANIGVPTGAVSGILVVDVDPRNGGDDSLKATILKHGRFPETAEQMTGGGGRHLFFRYAGGSVPKTLAEGIDLKGDGGYVVVAPSLHPSGNRYQWDGVAGSEAILNPADLPAWLRQFLSDSKQPLATTGTVPRGLPKIIPDGTKHHTIISLIGTLRKRNMPREAAFAACRALNFASPVSDADIWTQVDSCYQLYPAAAGVAGSLVTRRMSDIEAKPVSWLWPGRIARGKVSIIAGNPGLGKSQITASIAAIVTTGGRWPVDGNHCLPGDVVFLSAEDDPADTLRPRLEAAGANLRRVHVMDAVILGYTGEGQQQNRAFSLQRDMEALSVKLAELRDVAAVVIDPITAYLGDVDSHRNAEVRALLAPLSELAAQHGTAIIGVSHLNKSAGTEALMRVTGSLAFVAAARAAYLVAQDPENPTRRYFLPMKNNIGPDSAGLAFRIEGATVQSAAEPLETSLVVWEPEPVTTTADEVMRTPLPEHGSALREAEEWLRETLREPTPAAEISRLAATVGISEKTLRRAADSLRIVKEKTGMKGGWVWSLPPKMPKPPEDAQQKGMGIFEEVGHLRESEEAIVEVEL